MLRAGSDANNLTYRYFSSGADATNILHLPSYSDPLILDLPSISVKTYLYGISTIRVVSNTAPTLSRAI